MKTNLKKFSWTALLGGTLILAGCGGGGGGGNDGGGGGGGGGLSYSGSTAPASVSSSNAEELGVGTTEAAAKAIEASSADTGSLPFGISVTNTTTPAQQAAAINQQILESLQSSDLPLGITLGSDEFAGTPGYCGGSVTVPDSFMNGNTTSGTITYNNFCLDMGAIYGALTVNGSVTITNGVLTTYNNFTASFGNGTYLSCNGPVSACTTNAVYSGSGGTSYLVSDVNVSGNASSGYTVDASYCHSSYGCLTIETTSPIVFDCENGKPSTGSITFSSTNGSHGTITFNSCSSYTVSYALSSGGALTTISGTW